MIKIHAAGFRGSPSLSLIFYLVFLASLLVSGCATTGQMKGDKFPQPAQIVPPSVHASGNDAVDWIVARGKNVRSLKGIAKIKIVSGKKETRAREVIAIKRPSSFRLETLGFMGTPSMIIAADGPGYTIQVPAENRVFTWDRSSSENLVPVPFSLLETEEIADIFLGGTPIIDYGAVDMQKSDDKRTYTLTLISKDGLKKQVLVIDNETFQLRSSDISDGSRSSVMSLSYADYQDLDSVSFPMRIEALFLPGMDSIQINFEDVELNQTVDDDLFVLKPLNR